jgi:NAD(P)H dehydrogenase (quinone)
MNQRPTRHAIIVGHPARESFTHAMAARYADRVTQLGHVTVVRDLYRTGFDPVLEEERQPPAGASALRPAYRSRSL